MLIEMATGDAYGAAFEFTRTPGIPNDLSRFGSHPKGELPQGAYTDDTMRAVANIHVMLSDDARDRFRPEAYADAYLDIYRSDKRMGWSSRFQAMLAEHEKGSGIDLIAALRRTPTNGCLMGVAPLGHLPNADQVRLAATMQTVSTHAASAVPYAQAVALAAHHLLHGGTTADVVEYVMAQVEWSDDARPGDREKAEAVRFRRMLNDPPEPAMPASTIAACALWALTHFQSTAEALVWTCSRGGDTDSLGAVTMALAACATDMDHDLPKHLLEGVDTPGNREMLKLLDARLASTFQGIAK